MAKRDSGRYGFWDFLSGRAGAEIFDVVPRIQLKTPIGELSTGKNPIQIGTDELLVAGGLLLAGYLICKVTEK